MSASKPAFAVARLLTGVALAALASGCIKRDAPRMAAADQAVDSSGVEPVKVSAREDVARRWAAAYAANPKDPRAALNYARSLKAQGLNEQALDVLKRAYEATRHPDLASELGRLAMETGDLVAAAPALDAALAASPGDWRLLSAQGALYARKGQHRKAQDRFIAALERNPGSPSIINNLALSYAMDGRKSEAEQLLKTALEKGGNDRMRQNLVQVLRDPKAPQQDVAAAQTAPDAVIANVAAVQPPNVAPPAPQPVAVLAQAGPVPAAEASMAPPGLKLRRRLD